MENDRKFKLQFMALSAIEGISLVSACVLLLFYFNGNTTNMRLLGLGIILLLLGIITSVFLATLTLRHNRRK